MKKELILLLVFMSYSLVIAQGIPINQDPIFGIAVNDIVETFSKSGNDFGFEELTGEDLNEFKEYLGAGIENLPEIELGGVGEVENGEIDYGSSIIKFSKSIDGRENQLKDIFLNNDLNLCEIIYSKGNLVIYFAGPKNDNLNLLEKGQERIERNSMEEGSKFVTESCNVKKSNNKILILVAGLISLFIIILIILFKFR